MERDPAFRPRQLDGDEGGFERSLRPSSFDEFVGQNRVRENLLIAIEAARERGDVIDHVLLSGMPGLGKTTLAHLIADAMKVRIHATSGPILEHGRDLIGLLTNLGRGEALFIDEIHRMSKEAEEYLYSAMEDFQVDIVVDRGPDARTYTLPVQPFTLIGATTREGLLSGPFRGRFGIQEKLEIYPPNDLAEIILRSAGILRIEVEPAAAVELAGRSRGTPRYANRFLRRVRDVAQHRRRLAGNGSSGACLGIDMADVDDALERLGVDENGLDRIDRRILELLVANAERPVGLKTLAVSIGEEERTIEDVYEPFLIQKGLILKTPRGRLATALAHDLMKREGQVKVG